MIFTPDALARVAEVTQGIPRVVKRPLRVLLFASSATRDYQFLRSILVREMDKKRAELSIYLQLPPGVTERRGCRDSGAGQRRGGGWARIRPSCPGRKDDIKDAVEGLRSASVLTSAASNWCRSISDLSFRTKRWPRRYA